VNALCLRDKASGGEAHWRCDHVRTRHIFSPDAQAAAGGGLVLTLGLYTSTSWDGDAKVTASGTIDLSAVFGLPAGIKAISVSLLFVDETVGVWGSLSSTSTSGSDGISGVTTIANRYAIVDGIVPCDANGDVYFGHGGELDAVHIRITGYWS